MADSACISEIEEPFKPVIPVSSVLKDIKLAKRSRSSPCGDERLPAELEKNLDSISLLEIMFYHDFMKRPDKLHNQRSQIRDVRNIFLLLNVPA